MTELERFIAVVKRLRDPEHGCPWDSVQTNMTLRRFWTEELGEYLDALEEGNYDEVKEELGDLLLQVVLNAQVCQDEGRFSLEDTAALEADKMVRRHPHVFGDSTASTETELRKQWEQIKKEESGNAGRTSVLDGVPRSMPALARAHKMLAKAKQAGFRWDEIQKPSPLIQAVEADLKQSPNQVEDKLGLLMLEVVQLCRNHDLHAEEVLQKALAQFSRQFRTMEQHLQNGVQNATQEQMAQEWNNSK